MMLFNSGEIEDVNRKSINMKNENGSSFCAKWYFRKASE